MKAKVVTSKNIKNETDYDVEVRQRMEGTLTFCCSDQAAATKLAASLNTMFDNQDVTCIYISKAF
jgi:hypothetical protein